MSQETPHPRQEAAQFALEAAKAYGVSDFALAESLFARAARLDPGTSGYRCNLATARLALGKNDLARTDLQSALDPLEPLDCATFGLVLKTAGHDGEAAIWLRRALLLDPRQMAARINLSNLLTAEGRHDEAIHLMREGLAEMPGQVSLLNNLGLALHETGALNEALSILSQARALAPDKPEIALNLAHTLLMMGRMAEGFAAYEARPLIAAPSQAPRWQGENRPGKTLLVWCEQGLGDALQFVRLLPQAAKRAGNLLLACDPSLHRLFEKIAPCVDESAAPPAHEVQCPLLSLPHLLKLDDASLYGQTPYLQAAPPMALAGEIKIGLVWAGRRGHANDRNRSLSPDLLSPLLAIPGMTFYSLQIGRGPAPMGMIDLAPRIADLHDTASALLGLDLLISADTAPAHLAGALGRPVWTLLPFAPDWRWGWEGETTPWYPRMRLFRQKRPGDWPEVIEQVAQALQRASKTRSF
ncbi:MAG: hypothetical protein HQL45_02220 [Alphaproteobacteria bacterium]|nr:hypothetical protein [Alphaproteobacteria bacterium]